MSTIQLRDDRELPGRRWQHSPYDHYYAVAEANAAGIQADDVAAGDVLYVVSEYPETCPHCSPEIASRVISGRWEWWLDRDRIDAAAFRKAREKGII